MSAGEHRAEHGEDRMKVRPVSWMVQLVVWALLVGMAISVHQFLEIRRENEGLSFFDEDYQDPPYIRTFLFCALFLGGLCAYGNMCKTAGTLQFVANLDRELNVQQYVQQLRTATPVVQFTARCYHTEVRSRRVTGSDGHRRSVRPPNVAC